jgi:CheY-like chemotaxis protein
LIICQAAPKPAQHGLLYRKPENDPGRYRYAIRACTYQPYFPFGDIGQAIDQSDERPDFGYHKVDDDNLLVEVVIEFFSKIGYRIFGSYCADDALIYLNENDIPDLVITDVNMPGIDGIEFTKIIKKQYDVIVFVMTGYVTDDVELDALNAGAQLFFIKPFKFEYLLNISNEALKEKEIQGFQYQIKQLNI